MLMGTAAGLAGAFSRRVRGDVTPQRNPRWGWQARALLVGGGRTLGIGLGLGLVALIALAPFSTSATKAYFEPFPHRPADGIARVAFTALALPNVTFWALAPSTGSCIGFSVAPVASGVLRGCLISYSQFPPPGGLGGIAAAAPGMDLPPPPTGFFGFALVPLVAVVAGGWMAARRSARLGGRATEAGLLAGVGFAGWATVLAVLSPIAVSALGTATDRTELAIRIGPDILWTALAALAWGVAGGALGGVIASRRGRGPERSPTGPASAAATDR
jgi:hypothetical protein